VKAARELTVHVHDTGRLGNGTDAAFNNALKLGYVGHAVTVDNTKLLEQELVRDRILLGVISVQKDNT
jgi:hypothetical protein